MLKNVDGRFFLIVMTQRANPHEKVPEKFKN